MTIPWLMNCSHSPDGWCLECVGEMRRELEAAHSKLNALLVYCPDPECKRVPNQGGVKSDL